MSRGICSDPEKELARARKISESRQRKKAELGYVNSPETKSKIGTAGKGRKWTPEQRAKIIAKMIGRPPAPGYEERLAKARAKFGHPKGPESPSWKGDAVGYGALHAWVKKMLGAPMQCSRCGTTERKWYDWANVSGEYKRDISDWVRLCRSCHRKQDGFVPWNKGKKTGIVPKSAYKPGQRPSQSTEFKPGMEPHNKYLTTRPCQQCSNEFQPINNSRKFCGQQCYWASMRK